VRTTAARRQHAVQDLVEYAEVMGETAQRAVGGAIGEPGGDLFAQEVAGAYGPVHTLLHAHA
jgi:hypothetical protein